MYRVHYAVTASCPDCETATRYLEWLTGAEGGGHLRAVVDAGALDARAVRLDPPPNEPARPVRVMSVYTFESREAFAKYERDRAPALRQDGLNTFRDSGIEFRREVGEILDELPLADPAGA